MSYVLFHSKEQGRPHIVKMYNTEKGARIGLRAANRNAGSEVYMIMDEVLFNLKYPRKMVTRTNLMTGKEFQEYKDTPHYLSPASETYWSM
jgi:hypothetical protein